MAKKKKEAVNNVEVSDNLEQTRVQIRQTMRETFDKWMTIYDEEATNEDVNAAKEAFDAEVQLYQDKQYVIAENQSLEFAKLLREWNANFCHWEKGEWKGVGTFNKVINEYIEKFENDNTLQFEVDYATLMYLYKTMTSPSGYGLEQAKAMARFENFDPETFEPLNNDNYVTYSHLLQNIIENVRVITVVDKKLKLMRERINLAAAGIKVDWKITELEEFIELHDAWIGTAVPDGQSLQNM